MSFDDNRMYYQIQNCGTLQVVFLDDEQPYVQRIAAEAHVVLELVGLVCCLPNIMALIVWYSSCGAFFLTVSATFCLRVCVVDSGCVANK